MGRLSKTDRTGIKDFDFWIGQGLPPSLGIKDFDDLISLESDSEYVNIKKTIFLMDALSAKDIDSIETFPQENIPPDICSLVSNMLALRILCRQALAVIRNYLTGNYPDLNSFNLEKCSDKTSTIFENVLQRKKERNSSMEVFIKRSDIRSILSSWEHGYLQVSWGELLKLIIKNESVELDLKTAKDSEVVQAWCDPVYIYASQVDSHKLDSAIRSWGIFTRLRWARKYHRGLAHIEKEIAKKNILTDLIYEK